MIWVKQMQNDYGWNTKNPITIQAQVRNIETGSLLVRDYI